MFHNAMQLGIGFLTLAKYNSTYHEVMEHVEGLLRDLKYICRETNFYEGNAKMLDYIKNTLT